MKTIKITEKIFVMAAIYFSMATMANAQTTDKPALALPPVNGAPGRPPVPPGQLVPPPPAASQQLQLISTFSGSFVKMVANDDYIYDGFYIISNGDSLLVKFPPHLGKQMQDIAKSGERVTVKGFLTTNPLNQKEVRMYSVQPENHAEIIDTASIAQGTPPAQTYTSGSGKITMLQKNREGNVTGFLLDGKTILRIPPHIGNLLSPAAKVNDSVSYTGMKKSLNNGEVMAQDYAIVRSQTVTLNGQQYLIQ